MQAAKLKRFLYLLVAISAAAWFALSYFLKVDISTAKGFFGLIPTVVVIDFMLILVFVKWGWKQKIFAGWLVKSPDISGTWLGHIYSDWTNQKTGESLPPIPVMLTISQSFFNISCLMRTSEMVSSSYGESLIINSEQQIKKLLYSYTSQPGLAVKERSSTHDGTVVFEIFETPKRKLNGRYWTERNTTGEIKLGYYSIEVLEQLPELFDFHPITDAENRD